MPKILIIAEHDANQLKESTAVAISAALTLTDDVELLLACNESSLATSFAKMAGISKVLNIIHSRFTYPLAEDLAPIIASIAGNYSHVFAAATSFGKNLMPRVAALLDVMQISEITKIHDPQTFTRPIYAGNAYETLRSQDKLIVATIRTTAFKAVVLDTQPAPIESLSVSFTPYTKSEVKAHQSIKASRPDLSVAKIIVAGGRGLKNAENFQLLEKLADKLGAAIGASRAAVDAGFVSNDLQIGQTGKAVAPELYIAIGISGAIQHIAGMKDSKIIVAINQDPQAPIFEVADYGLVGDLFTLVPELLKQL